MDRRNFLFATISVVTSFAVACARSDNSEFPTTPSSPAVTSLKSRLERDGHTVVERTNLDGGVELEIDGRFPKIFVDGVQIGVDPSHNGPPNLNVGTLSVPDYPNSYTLV